VPEEENWFCYGLKVDCGIRSLCPARVVASDNVMYLADNEESLFVLTEGPDCTVVCCGEEYHASQMSVSPNGIMHWKVSQKSAFAANGSGGWYEVAVGVKQVAVNDNTAFVLNVSGVLYAHKDLSMAKRFSERPEVVTCREGMLSCVVATNGLLVGVTESQEVLGRTGMSASNKAGTTWAKLASLNRSVQSVDLSEYNNGVHSVYKMIAVTDDQRLLFAHATKDDLLFKPDLPWSEISVHQVTRMGNLKLCAKFGSGDDLWLWHGGGRGGQDPHALWRNWSSALGSRWRRLNVEQSGQRVRDVISSGITRHEGVLWATTFPLKPGRHDGTLFYSKIHDGRFHPMRLPALKSAIVCVAAAASPEACWILTSDGSTFMLSKGGPEARGGKWCKLDLSQLNAVR
jgi:hypothetical protein